MAAGSPLKYHESMGDLRSELYGLVAEAQALLQSLRLQGVLSVPAGLRQGVEGGGPVASAPGGAFVGVKTARPAVVPQGNPTRAPAAPATVRLPAPRPATPPAPTLGPTVHERSPPPLAPATSGGLLGRWGERLVPVDERLARVVTELGSTCEACGQPTLTGQGGLASNLVLIAGPASGESGVMLANMLLKVVLIEPGDAWWVHPRACLACADAVARQVAAVRPRVVLALGQAAGAMLGDPVLGEWTRYGQADLLRSWHPDDVLAEPARKRAVFGHLQELARRR